MMENLSVRKDTKVKHALSLSVYLLGITATALVLFNVSSRVHPQERGQTPLVGVRRGLLHQQTDLIASDLQSHHRKEKSWQYSLSFETSPRSNGERKLKGAKAKAKPKPNAQKTRSPKSIKSSKKTASTVRPTTAKTFEDPSVNIVPLPITEQNELVTCVSVIDENEERKDPTYLWVKLRDVYPNRPFCLLRPVPQSYVLQLPEGFEPDNSTIFYEEVTREAEDVTNTSDWYNLCKLEKSRLAGLTKVVLFVDNSSSMYTRHVQNAFDLFSATLAAKGMTIVKGVYNGNEDYISPCLELNLTSVEI